MKMNIQEYINSGVLELYVLGEASHEEILVVESLSAEYPEIRLELEAIAQSLEAYTMANAVEPDVTLKPFLMATLNYLERLEKGEAPVNPPILSEKTSISDFSVFIDRADFVLPDELDNFHARIIAHTPEAMTALVWIKELAPLEVHHDEHEKFLILEGTCNIEVEDMVYSLGAGDYFGIPLHKNHAVRVTSDIPCKVVLQRVCHIA